MVPSCYFIGCYNVDMANRLCSMQCPTRAPCVCVSSLMLEPTLMLETAWDVLLCGTQPALTAVYCHYRNLLQLARQLMCVMRGRNAYLYRWEWKSCCTPKCIPEQVRMISLPVHRKAGCNLQCTSQVAFICCAGMSHSYETWHTHLCQAASTGEQWFGHIWSLWQYTAHDSHKTQQTRWLPSVTWGLGAYALYTEGW